MTNSKLKTAAGESLLVVDAGGTKTAAWLVDLTRPDGERVIGRGRAMAGNPLSVGFADSALAIREAITHARDDAGQSDGCAARAILSIAGAANERLRGQFVEWARTTGLAERVAVVSDVLPVLAGGTPNCYGVALISGTGSVAFGRSENGRTQLCGGWGYLLGDEGSGFAIGRSALQQALRALELNAARCPLTSAVLNHVGASTVMELTQAVYENPHSRVAIAGVAPIVISAADGGDADAQAIVDTAAGDLAKLVSRTVQSIEPIEPPLVLAISGSVLLRSKRLQNQLHVALRRSGLECEMNMVEEPLAGCVRLAAPEYNGTLITWQ
ncbi:MAG: BadF/BadG/BcrA/BcrD type ATPase [Planctomycetes bacterium]|nr:BadF/BadG/BcrA/BcrD type ATPase [Planctomycetota bacterium]